MARLARIGIESLEVFEVHPQMGKALRDQVPPAWKQSPSICCMRCRAGLVLIHSRVISGSLGAISVRNHYFSLGACLRRGAQSARPWR